MNRVLKDEMTSSNQAIYREPRTVVLVKTDTGFGFNVRGQVNEGKKILNAQKLFY